MKQIFKGLFLSMCSHLNAQSQPKDQKTFVPLTIEF
jgi:hypothetical protein